MNWTVAGWFVASALALLALVIELMPPEGRLNMPVAAGCLFLAAIGVRAHRLSRGRR